MDQEPQLFRNTIDQRQAHLVIESLAAEHAAQGPTSVVVIPWPTITPDVANALATTSRLTTDEFAMFNAVWDQADELLAAHPLVTLLVPVYWDLEPVWLCGVLTNEWEPVKGPTTPAELGGIRVVVRPYAVQLLGRSLSVRDGPLPAISPLADLCLLNGDSGMPIGVNVQTYGTATILCQRNDENVYLLSLSHLMRHENDDDQLVYAPPLGYLEWYERDQFLHSVDSSDVLREFQGNRSTRRFTPEGIWGTLASMESTTPGWRELHQWQSTAADRPSQPIGRVVESSMAATDGESDFEYALVELKHSLCDGYRLELVELAHLTAITAVQLHGATSGELYGSVPQQANVGVWTQQDCTLAKRVTFRRVFLVPLSDYVVPGDSGACVWGRHERGSPFRPLGVAFAGDGTGFTYMFSLEKICQTLGLRIVHAVKDDAEDQAF